MQNRFSSERARLAPVVFLIFAAILAATAPAGAAARFARAFAPQEGQVAPPEWPYREELCLNGRWQFQPIPLPPGYAPGKGVAPNLPPPTANGWDKTPIRIPSPWNVNAFNRGDGGDFRAYPSYPKSWEDVSQGWLGRSFRVPTSWRRRRILLHFDAVAGDAQVYVNGRKVAQNFDLFLPFEADVTNAVKWGTDNRVLVGVRKASLFDDSRTVGRRTYPAGSFWGSFIAGIWQDVTLLAVPPVRVAEAFVKPRVGADRLEEEVRLRNDTNSPQIVRVSGQVKPWINLAGPDVVSAPEPKWRLGETVLALPAQIVTLAPKTTVQVTLRAKVGGRLNLWTPESPHLYGLVVAVKKNTQRVDTRYARFGWREWTIQGNRHLLNGKPYELRGDAWHFMGIPQMTRRYAWAWFTALKDAHANAVRLHAQPYPSFFLDVADEMGICVLDETANWGSDGGQKFDSDDFWRRSAEQQERLIARDRNHPAVFGWSLTNEDYAILSALNRRDLDPAVTKYLSAMTARVRELDPTRPWISGDGEEGPQRVLPTVVGHYVGNDWLRDRARESRPYGVGEAGGAYYATPKEAANFAGPEAYRSQAGRMEGLAIEAYALIAGQRAAHADYGSVFNLVWYGLQPLEIGLTDTARPPALSDGIFFGPFREGQPGAQPERLGPYCTTLNPGYDPRLPLYRPWPLFGAIQAANAPGGPRPCRWDHRFSAPVPPAPEPIAPITAVAVLAGPGSSLPLSLGVLGVKTTGAEPLENQRVIVIDGAHPPASPAPDLIRQVAQAVGRGATVWVVDADADPARLAAVNAFLPFPLALTDRESTSLLITAKSSLLDGLTDADFYFTESAAPAVMRHGLAGPFVAQGTILAAACNTDWRRWNGRPEPMKTAATLRSEREAKPGGAALVERRQGAGRYLVSAWSALANSDALRRLQSRLWTNLGVQLSPPTTDKNAAFSPFGALTNALVCGSFATPSAAEAYDRNFGGITRSLRPTPGTKSGEREWRAHSADAAGVFDFRTEGLPGPTENSAVYLSFRLWSPLDLSNLLLNPNLPKVDLGAGCDDGCQIWLNGKLVGEDRGTHPLTPDSIQCKALPLQKGWNQFQVKVVQGTGEWQFAATLHADNPAFLAQLRSAVAQQ